MVKCSPVSPIHFDIVPAARYNYLMKSKSTVIAAELAAVIAFNILFPIIALGSGIEILFYLGYATALGSGAYLINDQRLPRALAVVFAALTFSLGVWNALLPFQLWSSILWGASLVGLQLILIYGLLRFIFNVRHVTIDVIVAGITVYLLLGTLFVPIYTQLEAVLPGSFSINTAMSEMVSVSIMWTRFLYFSYATLTTLGYGDITPISGVAQALSTTEAIVGVLYIAIFMARLVGAYASDLRRMEPLE